MTVGKCREIVALPTLNQTNLYVYHQIYSEY
jgi:hypothetical protein